MSLSDLFLLFIIYSVVGWVCEVLYCSFLERKFVNRGFLAGPLCPVYGFGGLLVIFLLKPFSGNMMYLFVMAVLTTSTLEYVTGWALETIFATKWWDYSNSRFNIHGRVCLFNSLVFGLLSVGTVTFVHPAILSVLGSIPADVRHITATILCAVFVIDITFTLRTLVDFRGKLYALEEFAESIKESIDVREWFNEHDLVGSLERLRERASRDASGAAEKIALRLERLAVNSRGVQRLIHAFPALRRQRSYAHIDTFREERFTKAGFFGQFWNFLFASLAGGLLETVWVLLTTGSFQSRSGLVFGSLNPLYGFGAVIMVSLLARLEKKRDLTVFAGSALIGASWEYACGLAQELAFGTVSWDYSGTQFNVYGRTNLISALIWGVLGLLWIRDVMPVILGLIGKMRPRVGKIIALMLVFAVSLDCTASSLAVFRWSARADGIAPNNALERMIDDQFPDERMRGIYPNMHFVEGESPGER
jgi:uncharacterized membrane protein